MKHLRKKFSLILILIFIVALSLLFIYGYKIIQNDKNTQSNGKIIVNDNNNTEIVESIYLAVEYNSQEQSSESDNALQVASLVVTWSGVVLSFLTIIAGIIGFVGFRELRNFQKARNEINEMKNEFEEHVKKIAELEGQSKDSLDKLVKNFEIDAQNIMQATYYFTMGSNTYIDAKYSDAIMYLKKSLEYLPRSTDSLCLLGRAYTIIGETSRSDECFKRALEIDPDCSAAYRGLAAWHRRTSLDKALEYAQLAVDKNPDNFETWNYLGQLLRDKGNNSEAMEAHLKSYGLKKHPDTAFFLSLLYAEAKLLDWARVYIQESINLYENDIEFTRSRKVWKQLAHWVSHLLSNSKNLKIQALNQLDKVTEFIDNKRTQGSVIGHVTFLLSALDLDEEYIANSLKRVKKYD